MIASAETLKSASAFELAGYYYSLTRGHITAEQANEITRVLAAIELRGIAEQVSAHLLALMANAK